MHKQQTDTSVKPLRIKGVPWLRYCKPVCRDLISARRIADNLSRDELPKGFWIGVVSDNGTHYDITFSRRRPSTDIE